MFLRRLNGLGQLTAASLFPKEQFDEQAVFAEVVSAMPTMEHIVTLVNDIFSFYKEFDAPDDQTVLVMNICAVEGISITEALDKLTEYTIRGCQQLFTTFEEKDSQVNATVKAFTMGYITWHLCDGRYRMREIYDRLGDGPIDEKFRVYYEYADQSAGVDLAEWTGASLSKRLPQADE